MTLTSNWEGIYSLGGQLNRYPYSECVAYFKRRWPDRVPAGFRALDVGCGSGVHAHFFATHGADVTAFDFSPSAIKHAREVFATPEIDYRVNSLRDFDAGDLRFDLVFDRLSSTHSSLRDVEHFYQRLRRSLKPGAQVFWQGYTMENSGRALGRYNADTTTWEEFSGGVFENLGQTVFFSEADLEQVFDGYAVDSRRVISDLNLETGYLHSYWMLELSIPTGTADRPDA